MDPQPASSTDLELLKKDVNMLSGFMVKLDTAIDKLTDVANSLDRVIAVHEEKLEAHERIDQELHALIEERRKESKEQYELLHLRISGMKDDFDTDMKSVIKEINENIKEMKEFSTVHHNEVSERLTKLEMWKWYVIGMATLGGFILSFIPDMFF
jgi:DNA repair exonuclease SbcCD ATPase subunit